MSQAVAETKGGKGRATRPDGSFYSSDPRERALQLKEDGKIGGQFGKLGGRPRRKRASEEIAELAYEEMESIKGAFRDALSSGESRVRTGAAKDLLAFTEKEEDRKEREAERNRDRNRDYLMSTLVERLTGDSPAAEEFRRRIEAEEVIDVSGDAIEYDEPVLEPAAETEEIT